MASTGINAQGTTFTIDTVDIENVTGWSGFDGEANPIDKTTLSSIAKEKELGLQDFGQVTLNWQFVVGEAGQDDCRSAQAAGTAHAFVFTYKDGATATFQGRVKNATNQDGSVDTMLTGGCAIEIDGNVTFVAGP